LLNEDKNLKYEYKNNQAKEKFKNHQETLRNYQFNIEDCERRRNERYDNTGLFTVTYQLVYRHCTCTVQGVGVHPLV
jgi:hypothetical protein